MTALWLLTTLALAEPETPEEPVADEASEQTETAGPERSSPPAVIPAEPIALDEPSVHDLGNGTVVWHVPVPGVRKVEVRVMVYGGTQDLDEWPTALAQSAMDWADIATGTHSAEQLEILGDVHDIELYSWMGDHNGGIGLSVPREELELGLKLAREVLKDPAFPSKDLKQYIRDEVLWYEITAPSSLTDVSWEALEYAWTPADHPYGARPDLKSWKKLKNKDLMAKQRDWRTSGPAGALVVGDVAWKDVEPLLKPVLEGLGTDEPRSEQLTPPAFEKTRVVAVDMPGQAQTALRLQYAAPPRDHEDRVAFYAMNWAFGGHFLSRLNANLREDKGFTYGSGSAYRVRETTGTVTVYVDVKAENTAAAITEIEHEIDRLVDGDVTAEELDMAVQSMISNWNGTRETASSARRFYSGLLANEETVAEARARLEATQSLEPGDAKTVAEKYFADKPHLWIVVGDRSAIQAQLDGLGWDVEWVTPVQAVMGDL